MNNYSYREDVNPLTGDIIWRIEDISLALGGVDSLIEKFIDTYYHEDYSLSIFDTLEAGTIEIDCDIKEMPKIVDYIYHFEKGTPLTFIGINSLTDSYVVGMSLSMGRIDHGSYKAEDGKIIKVN